jgi:hypothetical protein
MANLTEFKNFIADRCDVDQLVSLVAFGKQLRAEYDALQLEEPEWVDVQLKSLRREIFARNADALEARRREINSRLDALKTPGQRKSELLQEKAEIDKKLKAVGA